MERMWWLFFVLAIIELGLILILWLKPIKKRKPNNSNSYETANCNQTIVKLMRLYRHDWLNHMQVVLGYLSLKKYDKIKEYMDRVNAIVKQDSIISNFDNKDLAAYLYLLPVNYPKLDIQLDIDPNVKEIVNNIDGNQFVYYLNEFTKLFADGNSQQAQIHPLYISMLRHPQSKGIIMTIEYEGDITSFYDKILSVGEQFKKENRYFSIDLLTDNEFIMELQFRAKDREKNGGA